MKKLIFIVCVLALTACHKGRSYIPKDLPPQEMEMVRFDNAILNVNEATVAEDIRVLYNEYPVFMPLWVEDILGIPSSDTAFLVNKGFTRIKYLYPEAEIPTIYLFISGFQTPIYFGDELIGIGADMYLGSDYEYYNRVVYDYQKQTMRKECIPVDVVSAYLFRTLPYTGTRSRLLDQMIYRGKVMYLTSLIYDDQPGYEVMGWKKEQWDWCVRNEEAIWHLVMDKRDLFKTESLVLASYLNDGPFTSEVSQDSPGRLGIWLGWRIVESYMAHNETVSMQELMAEPDAQKILEESYYKP